MKPNVIDNDMVEIELSSLYGYYMYSITCLSLEISTLLLVNRGYTRSNGFDYRLGQDKLFGTLAASIKLSEEVAEVLFMIAPRKQQDGILLCPHQQYENSGFCWWLVLIDRVELS